MATGTPGALGSVYPIGTFATWRSTFAGAKSVCPGNPGGHEHARERTGTLDFGRPTAKLAQNGQSAVESATNWSPEPLIVFFATKKAIYGLSITRQASMKGAGSKHSSMRSSAVIGRNWRTMRS